MGQNKGYRGSRLKNLQRMEIRMQNISVKEEAGWIKGKTWEDSKGYFSCKAWKLEKRRSG